MQRGRLRMGRPGAAGRVGRGPGETAPGKGNLPGRSFSGNVGWSVIIIDDNYNLTTTANHKVTKAQRTLKKIRDGPPALRSVRAGLAGRRSSPGGWTRCHLKDLGGYVLPNLDLRPCACSFLSILEKLGCNLFIDICLSAVGADLSRYAFYNHS